MENKNTVAEEVTTEQKTLQEVLEKTKKEICRGILDICDYDGCVDSVRVNNLIQDIINKNFAELLKSEATQKTQKTIQKYGSIKKTNYFSEIIGSLTFEDDKTDKQTKFSLKIGAITRTPIIINEDNGRAFTLTWEDLVSMAIDYGILEDEPIEVEDVKTE